MGLLKKPARRGHMKLTPETTARDAYHYAKDVVKGRWKEAEPIIQQDAGAATMYACNLIKGRWPKAEPVIKQEAHWANFYARYVIKGRWQEAEPFIQQNAMYAYLYAKNVIKGRWTEAEPIIQQNAEFAYYYARDVVKGRWEEAEQVIANHKTYFKEQYISEFFDEPVGTKDEVAPFKWKHSGATGYFAPKSLIEGEPKHSLLDAMLQESPQEAM